MVRPMNVIFLGAPGAGKGTQAEKISQILGIPTISTGNIIRAAIKDGTDMGLKAREFTESGKLVPDDVVIGIIKERLSEPDCASGFILDGFPRTIPQAEALDRMGIRIDKVVDIDVDDSVISERMAGRRVCKTCGSSYHIIFKKPETEGICDNCGGELVIRDDDRPETVSERLRIYHDATEPLKEYYQAKGILAVVKGQHKIDDTTQLTLKALEADQTS